jgi:hypothetical protein
VGGFFPVQEPILFLSGKEGKKFNPRVDYANGKFDELIGKKIKSGTILDFKSLPEYLDEGFLKVLKKALHKNCEKRYQTTAHFMKDVHDLLRKYPDYQILDEILYVRHSSKEFRITQNEKGDILLEKKLNGKTWRKDNNHDGTYFSAIMNAKNG